MLDIGSGSRTLLADAFTMCGWITTTIDNSMESEKSYGEAKEHADKALLICATFPCDGAPNLQTPETFDDGRQTRRVCGKKPPLKRSKPTPPGDSVKILQLFENHTAREGISIRESPGNSVHWSVPEEESLTDNNDWFDLNYSPCVFGGERRTDLKMRHNIDELNNVCPLSCHHTHDVDEWECSRSSSHQEETSRTAALCFYIAVSCGWCALRLGHAVLKIARIPSPSVCGDRTRSTRYHPRAARIWGLLPTAIVVGLAFGDKPTRSSPMEEGLRASEQIIQRSWGGTTCTSGKVTTAID